MEMTHSSTTHRSLFISGTDTGIGKTTVSSLLVAALKEWSKTSGLGAGYYKPIQTGQDSDTATVAELTATPPSEFPSPAYYFKEPAAPSRASLLEGVTVQLDSVAEKWKSIQQSHQAKAWVVEGAGGLLVPLNSEQTIRDLISCLNMKLLIVASTRLGTMNHTLLTVEAARKAGISIAGIVFVGDEDPELESSLGPWLKAPIIARIPRLNQLTPEAIREAGMRAFPPSKLRLLYELS